MKRKLTTLAVLLATMVMQAQTARQFTINLTDDGQANMVCFLADHPTGRAIVGVPRMAEQARYLVFCRQLPTAQG